MTDRLAHYARWIVACRLGGRRIPLTASLVLTDRCNLHCRHCTVAHLGYPLRTFGEVRRDVVALYATGARVLVITGGEPYEWSDGAVGLEDVVATARGLGFFRVVVCTNGTHPLKSSADFLWVSLDGPPADHDALRGTVHAEVVANLAASRHPGVYVNFTVTRWSAPRLRESAEHVLSLPGVRGVLFHLFTPYLGSDPELRLDPAARAEAIADLKRLKRRHPLRVSNSLSGLRELARDGWPRPVWSSVLANGGVLSPCCCRPGIYDEEVCRQCGCTPAVETYVLERLRPLAVLENLRFL